MKAQTRQRGMEAFTLAELLVVLATLAVLVCLMLPARAGVEAQTAVTQCSDNERLFALALQTAAADSNDRFPTVSSGNWPWDLPKSTKDILKQYGMERRHFYCPANTNQNVDVFWEFSLTYSIIGYAMTLPASAGGSSVLITSNLNAFLTPRPLTIGVVRLPPPPSSQRVLLADATVCAPVGSPSQANASTYNWTQIAGGAGFHRTSHMSLMTNLPTGGNSAMLDGHVEWVRFAPAMIPRTSGSAPVFWW